MQNKAVWSLDLNKIDFRAFFPPPPVFSACLQQAGVKHFKRKRLLVTIKLGELLQPGFLWKKNESRKWERKKRCKTVQTHFAKENRAAKIVVRSSGRLTSPIAAAYCHEIIQIPALAARDSHHRPPPSDPTWAQLDSASRDRFTSQYWLKTQSIYSWDA